MGTGSDEGVRAELARRVAAMSGRGLSVGPRELASEVDAVRALAARAGLLPAVAVAHLLDDALSRGERGPMVGDWLRVLGDAVASGRSDAAATDAYAAACAVRFVG
jgi:hypothetical protein